MLKDVVYTRMNSLMEKAKKLIVKDSMIIDLDILDELSEVHLDEREDKSGRVQVLPIITHCLVKYLHGNFLIF